MVKTVALWAPDIEPPDNWLIPAVLYQDKIATFAPDFHLDDRDGRTSRRIARILGDFYERVGLTGAYAGIDQIENEIRARLPSWIDTAQRADPVNDSYIGRWAERAASVDQRRKHVLHRRDEVRSRIRQAQLDEVRSNLRHAQHEEERIVELVERQQGLLSLEEHRLASVRDRVRRQLEPAKLARKREIAPFVEQVQQLSQRGRRLDRSSEEYREISTRFAALKTQIDATRRVDSHAGVSELRNLEERIKTIRAELKNLQTRLNFQREMRQVLAEDYRQLDQRCTPLSRLEQPWLETEHFRPEDLWSLPHELDTIAGGKVCDRMFEFLASSAGMWVVRRRDIPYLGTLVGPSFVINEIMMIVALHVMKERDNYVLMVDEQRRDVLNAPTDSIATAAAVTWLLPVPRTSDIAAALAFREKHADELLALREYIQAPLSAAASPSELREAILDIQAACQAAAVEIARALELERRVGLAYIRCSTVSGIGANLRDAVVAAGLGTIPVFQTGMAGGDPLAGLPAGFLVTGIVLTASTVIDSVRASTARRHVHSPFLYSYEALRASERWRSS